MIPMNAGTANTLIPRPTREINPLRAPGRRITMAGASKGATMPRPEVRTRPRGVGPDVVLDRGEVRDQGDPLAEPVEVDLDVTLGHQYPLCMIEPPPKSSSSSGRGRAGRAGGGGAGAGGGGGSSACSAFNSHRGVSAAGSSAISGAGICSSRKCIAALSVPINGAITVLSWIYFFALPIAFLSLITLCLIAAAWRSAKPA